MVMYGVAHKATELGLQSSKPLALTLKSILKPNDTVLFYDYYYQDLAFYLNRTVLLAGDFQHEKIRDVWRQDFSEGLKNPSFRNHTLSIPQLQHVWLGPKRVYLFTITQKLQTLKKQLPPYYLVGYYHELVLLTNHLPAY